MTTKVRVELYFFLAMFAFIYVVGLASETDIPEWFPLIIPVCLLWFWFVYRVQEKMLFARLKNYLMNNKNAPQQWL